MDRADATTPATPSPLDTAVQRSAEHLRAGLGTRRPGVAVLLGSGWGALADAVRDPLDWPYAALPAFPELHIRGHAGLLRSGWIGPTEVLVLAGRKHAYEDGDAAAMKGVVRTLAAIGVHTLVQTNAAGSLDEQLPPGRVMLISDHLNLTQRSPLFGERGDARFVGLNEAYDPALRREALAAAQAIGQPLSEGVYAWMMGPQFETPAEIRMLRVLGARAVGMSTVPETILARHAGLKVLALSLVTNLAAGLSDEDLSHAHTLHMAQQAARSACALLAAVVGRLGVGEGAANGPGA
jgi:purine-nucleoside phosphorylase